MEHIKSGSKLNGILRWVQEVGASDLHLQENKPARCRVEGRLKVAPDETVPTLNREELLALLAETLSVPAVDEIRQKTEGVLSLEVGTTRGRPTFRKQKDKPS